MPNGFVVCGFHGPLVKHWVISQANLNAMEFFWPQLVHAHFRSAVVESIPKTLWLEELLLSICRRSVHLALLLVWELQVSD